MPAHTRPAPPDRHSSRTSSPTFMTPPTSPSSPVPPSPPPIPDPAYDHSRLAPSLVSGLRKAVSVDSFSRYHRPPPPPALLPPLPQSARAAPPVLRSPPSVDSYRPPCVRTASADTWTAPDSHSGPSRYSRPARSPPRTLPDKRNGHTTETDTSEQPGYTSRPDDLTPKATSSSKPSPSPLWLPSRVTDLKTQSSIGSLQHNSRAPRPPSIVTPPLVRMSSAPRSGDTTPGRIRSGSLDQGGRPDANRLGAPSGSYSPSFSPEISVAIVGSASSGKSTFIRKALKAYTLVEPAAANSEPPRVESPFNYSYHLAKFPNPNHAPDRTVRVFEVDSADLPPARQSSSQIWPPSGPHLDGVIIAYDASLEASFAGVQDLLGGFVAMSLPCVVVACKSDLERRVDPAQTASTLREYDAGLVEVDAVSESGKSHIRLAFEWLLKAILRERRSSVRVEARGSYRNPASPEILTGPRKPWDNSRSETTTPTPVPMSDAPSASTSASSALSMKSSLSPLTQRPKALPHQSAQGRPVLLQGTPPTSPVRARSMNDLTAAGARARAPSMMQREESAMSAQSLLSVGDMTNASVSSIAMGLTTPDAATAVTGDGLPRVDENAEDRNQKAPGPPAWGTVDELAYKLVYVAVAGDDPVYIDRFLLTYRRFASPRAILLAMQKRLRELDSDTSADPMFASFAQMRICHLLETWTKEYPNDFAVRGTAGALSALVKSVLTKTYLLHYGSDFLPFLEVLPSLVDKDAAWALKLENRSDGSDESFDLEEDEDDDDQSTEGSEIASPAPFTSSPEVNERSEVQGKRTTTQQVYSAFSSRERKSSLPLTAKALMTNGFTSPASSSQLQYQDAAHQRQIIKDLLRISQDLTECDPQLIAEEITRIQVDLFLKIEPRHWLQHILVSGKKDPQSDSIARFNRNAEQLAKWAVSLILAHDKAKARAKQIERLVEIASKLRGLDNYSALRAFVAGINVATSQGDLTMEIFERRAPELFKQVQSWNITFSSVRSHRAYRMALRGAKGAAIPALEVHIGDLIRSHEGNPDFSPVDSTKVHWAKWDMIARFIGVVTDCQRRCRTTNDYSFPERPQIALLWSKDCLMDEEMQAARMDSPTDAENHDRGSTYFPARKDGTRWMRKLGLP